MKVATLNNRVFNVDKTAFYWKKMPSETSIAREEKSTPGFKLQRIGWFSCKGLMQLVTWSWSQCSFTILKILGPLRITLNRLCLCSINGTTKPGMTAHLFTNTDYFKPTFETYCSEKKNSFLNITAYWQCTWSPKSSGGNGQWDWCCFHAC